MRSTIGVVIPAYNASPFIREAIRSVVAQDEVDITRLVVVNDGSQDDTVLVAQSEAARDSRIQVLTVTNGGPGRARNIGARTIGRDAQLLCFLDADDILEPNALSTLVEVIRSEHIGAHGLGRFIDENSLPITSVGMQALHSENRFQSHPLDLAEGLRKRRILTSTGPEPLDASQATGIETLCLGNCILSGSFLIRSDVFHQSDGYPEGRLVEDWEMYVRASAFGPFAFLDLTTMCYRLHGPGLMSSAKFARDGAAFRLDLRALLSDDLCSLYDKFVLKEMVRPLIRMALGSLKRGRVSDFRFYSGIARRAWLVSR